VGGTFLEGILALKRDDDDLFEEDIFFFNFLIQCRDSAWIFDFVFSKSSFDESRSRNRWKYDRPTVRYYSSSSSSSSSLFKTYSSSK